jgi:pilus assembly protein CpaD
MRARYSMPGAASFTRLRVLILAPVLVAGVMLSGCDSHNRGPDDVLAVKLNSAEFAHPIDFTKRTEELEVEVPDDTEGLSSNQRVDVYRFLERFKREAAGRLTIAAPSAPRDPASIAHSLKGIQREVADAGIDYRITRVPRSKKAEMPLIKLSYQRPVALPPTCDHWQENVGRNEPRLPYANFGCATQRNTAVMIDNARDLKRPQGEDPRSSERRSVTWSGYIGAAGGKGDGESGGGDAAKKGSPAPKK